jgi:hypothetical protein
MGTRFARLWRSFNHYLLQFRQRSQLDRLLGILSAPEKAALTLPAENALASVIIPALN